MLLRLLRFSNNFYFPQKLTAWEWYGFPQAISLFWEFVHSQILRIAWIFTNSNLWGRAEDMKNPCIFKYTIKWESDRNKKHPCYGKSMSTNFSGSPHNMGFVAFSHATRNWREKPCIFPMIWFFLYPLIYKTYRLVI